MTHARKPCPHCGRTLPPGPLRMHVRKCPNAPGMREAVRAALDDGCSMCVSSFAYAASAPEGLPGVRALLDHYGTWANVATAHGLRAFDGATTGAQIAQTARLYAWLRLRDTGTALVDTTGCARVATDYTFDGLPVLTDATGAAVVRPVRGGVAYMVR